MNPFDIAKDIEGLTLKFLDINPELYTETVTCDVIFLTKSVTYFLKIEPNLYDKFYWSLRKFLKNHPHLPDIYPDLFIVRSEYRQHIVTVYNML